MCRDPCSVEAHRSHSVDFGVLSSKRFPAQSAQSTQQATKASRQGAQIDWSELALVPARSRNPARLDGRSDWHHPGAARTLVFGHHSRDLYSLGSSGRTASSRRGRKAFWNQWKAKWTQMDPNSGMAGNGVFANQLILRDLMVGARGRF